jgi:hypothetical protein
MGGIGEPGWLRDEGLRRKHRRSRKLPEGCFRALLPGGRPGRFDVDMTPYRLIRRTETVERAGTASVEIVALRLYQPQHIGELADRYTRASKIQRDSEVILVKLRDKGLGVNRVGRVR